MSSTDRHGFSLIEVLVALVLFAAVLLAMLSSGQFILARLYESDLRFRASVTAQSVFDSLRATACARLTGATNLSAPFVTSWAITDMLDVTRVDISVSVPQRAGAVPRVYGVSTLLNCPEP